MLKKNYRKIGKKNDNNMDANVAQLERSNNKCYASTFRYIEIDWLCYCYLHGLNQSFFGRWIHLHYHIYLHHGSIQIKMKAEIFV